MIFSSFFSGTTFLLPLVFSVLVWILSKPRIRTLVWVRCSIQGFLFLFELICESLLGLFSFSGMSFLPALFLQTFLCCFYHHLRLKLPDIDLKWSLCLSLMPLIVMLMSGGSSLRLITMTSVFLLFSSSPFSLLFDSTMFRSCCRSFSFSEIRTVSSAYLRLFMLCPPTRIPGCPSMFRMIISLYRENRSGESTHPCQTPLFIF